MFDLKTEFPKYGEYHANKVNVAIHMLFVPTIMWCTLGLVTWLTPHELFTYPAPIATLLSELPGPSPLANATALAMLGFIAFYVTLEPLAGLLTVPIIYTFLVTSQKVVLEATNGIQIVLAVSIVAWIAQFIGHGIFEKRAPALLDNLVQALVMAPFFVFLEALFACGYRPDLHRALRSEVGVRILAYRHAQRQKAAKTAKAK
ncbi:hypothetical protein FBU31_003239 [Coemansia sp. 'formosensis']|nr:hypothetical protein FBU31_003239 [Coemansia sp. 'formosensis']